MQGYKKIQMIRKLFYHYLYKYIVQHFYNNQWDLLIRYVAEKPNRFET